MLAQFASRLPSWPALVVIDSAALTPYMSQVVPGCEFLFATTTDGSVRTSRPLMFVVPAACQPLCAPHLAAAVPPIESMTDTNRPSLPRRSFQSTYSRHAIPKPPNAAFFQRSGSTPNCCQRCWSVEPSCDCGVMKFVSGHIAYSRFGSTACDFLKKYWTCEPGVSSPSGMMFVNSFVVAEPFQPERDLGTVLSHAGTVPSQTTLLSVGELVADLVVSTTKHTNLLTPSVANLGSLSWIVVWYRPASRPVPVRTAPPTGKMFNSSVSMRQLFHVSGS